MQRTVVSEPNLPSAQSASVAHFSCCEHTGQSFVPVLSVVQSGATVGLLLDGVSSHTRCLPSLHLLRLQLHGVYVIIFTPSQDRSHFGVVLACQDWLHTVRLLAPLWIGFGQGHTGGDRVMGEWRNAGAGRGGTQC